MNRFTIFFIAAFIIFFDVSDAQWFWQNPLPQGNTLRSVKFISPLVGWAVGENGTILRTTNGGTAWTEQSSGTTIWLYSVSFTKLFWTTLLCLKNLRSRIKSLFRICLLIILLLLEFNPSVKSENYFS